MAVIRGSMRRAWAETAAAAAFAVALAGASLPQSAVAQPIVVTSKVGTSGSSTLCIVPPNSATCRGSAVEWRFTPLGFTAASPAPTPTPSDSRSHTSIPLSPVSGNVDGNADGWLDIPFRWTTASVRDVGTYHYLVECTFTTDGATLNQCTSNTLSLVIFNSPPTASISIAGTPAIRQTVTLNANSGDADGGVLSHAWRIVSPSGRAATLASPNAASTTLSFVDERDIGNWRIELDVDDDERERKTFATTFSVPNLPPDIAINGATEIDALQTIALTASTTTDPDGGPPLVLRWDILSSPPGASLGPQSNYQGGPAGGPTALSIPTADRDIGTWRFRLTARDNDNAANSEDSAEVEVKVRNLPPKITLSPAGDFEIDAGQTIAVANTTPDDPDGGPVTHDWELIQAPVAAGVAPGRGFRTGPALSVANAAAGTWIFKLRMTDNDASPDSEVTQTVKVVVDGPVAASIGAPATSGVLAALTLDGSGSADADSPGPAVPNRGHVTSAGAVDLSPGIVSYQWSLIDVPPEHFPEFVTGPVEYSLGVANGSAQLAIGAGHLRPGSWTFQLEVVDYETNRDVTTHTVLVLEPNTPPIAIAGSTGYTLTDVAGTALSAAATTAAASFDLDNLIASPYALGLGISNFAWQYLLAPAGCQAPPAPPSGAGAATFQLFAGGSAIPTLCHGSYLLGVTVTDDDQPPLSTFTQVPLSIGNCPGEICIDYPTSANYKYVEFAERADVTVFYHLNSALYANPLFAHGVRLELALFHESDLANPAWTGQVDYDVLSALYMGYAAANWPGFTNSGARPRPGKYTIRVRATQPLLPAPFSEAVQSEAIWLEVLDVSIGAGSDNLLSLNRVSTGDALRIDYSVSAHFTAGPSFDEAWLHIRAAANPGAVIGSIPIPSPQAGTFRWTGELSPGVQVSPGAYTAEVEIRKAGRSLGTSARHAFTAYRIDVQVDGTPSARKQTPGAVLEVNGAAKNLTVKLEPASLTGDVTLRTSGNPGSTEVKEGAAVLNTDAAAGAVQPASGYAAPKVFTVKMLSGTSSPTRLEATYAPAGNPAGKEAQDFVNLHGLDLGLRPFCSNDATNASSGAFVVRNPTPLAGNFEQLKFVMLPITVTAQPTTGASSTEVSLDYESGSAAVAALYEAGGAHAAVALPKTWTRADFDPVTKKLEVKLLANGADYGEVVLRLQYKADGNVIAEKKLKLRVGDAPGLAGAPRLIYPEFLYQRVFSEGSPVATAIDPARYADRVGRKAKVYVVRHKSPAEWALDNTIAPVALVASPEVTFSAAGVGTNVAVLGAVPPNNLALEQGYDVVYDFGACPSDASAFATDLRLDPGDIVDSLAPDQPSLVMLPNALIPGPHGVAHFEYGTPPAPPSAPTIVAEPTSQSVAVGGTATFAVGAAGAALSYQWQRNGVDIPGATLASHTTGPVGLADHGARYRCVVRNVVGGVAGSASSVEAVLRVPGAPPATAPAITTDPTRQTVTEGRTTASFTVAAAGAGLSYQWQKNGVDIPGANAASYTTPPQPIAEDGAKYRCVVRNVAGTEISAEAALRIVPVTTAVPAAYNGLAAAFSFRLRGRVAHPNPLPAAPAKVPLVAIAHGNHTPLWVNVGAGWEKVPAAYTSDENYRGYAYLQDFLASHGFASVSVDLDEMVGNSPAMPASAMGYPDIDMTTGGIVLRANVLLRNVEEILSNPSVAGALAGRLDPADIHLLGHSRGGEAVIVATGLLAGTVAKPMGAPAFAPLGVRSVTSLAPMAIHTVNPPLAAPPAATPFMLLYGSADGDVNGATRREAWPFAHFDRASGPAHQIYLRGANHNAWNTSWPNDDAVPACGPPPGVPTPLNASRLAAGSQRDAARAYVFAFLQHYRRGQPAYGAYFSAPPALLRPAGLPDDSVLPLMGALRRNAGPGKAVVDDYESNFGNLALTSSATPVSHTLATLSEEILRDTNLLSEAEPHNRFFQATQGAMLGWAAASDYSVQLPAGSRDLRSAALALRLALRPPDGTTVAPDVDFSLTLVDAAGNTSTVPALPWRRVRGTYPTVQCGTATTKAAFETFAFPWWAFVANGRTLDLGNVTAIRFDFTPPAAAVGIDDLEIWK